MQNVVKAVSAQVHDGQLEIVFSTGMKTLWPISGLQFAKRIDGRIDDVLTNFYPNAEDLSEVEVWPSDEVIEFSRIDQRWFVCPPQQG